MSFAIVVDSVADLSEEECARFGITSVPLSVEVGGDVQGSSRDLLRRVL